MLNDDRKVRVFVSSTSEDLAEYRAAARLVILDVGWDPSMQEHMGASPDDTVDACLKLLEKSDVVLLLVAFRRGWVPSAEQGGNGLDSITSLELAHARRRKIPVLIMMATDTWPGKLWDKGDEAVARQERFRAQLNQPAMFFEWESAAAGLPIFRGRVREVLLGQKARLLEQKARTVQSPSLDEYLRSAYEGLIGGTSVPFLGPGVYGTGPLSSETLARALLGGTYNPPDLCLATAAEYRERILRSRDQFLRQFRRVLESQEAQVSSTAAHDLITAAAGPSLIVDATFDRVLVNGLAARGQQFAIVSHIVRSAGGEHNGKILVLRPEGAPEICLADKVNLGEHERVIYKPLGSPFLHDRLDPELEIDTVVATETDHITFLGRLENQHTQIPARVQRLLKRRALLFLGYGLDVWQHRLVMQVFQSIGRRGPDSATLAVRVADSPIEEVSWRRLGADVISMDANEFARRVSPEYGALGAG
jgi:Domain of unknown function (DUF4062)/SIR2-like domain